MENPSTARNHFSMALGTGDLGHRRGRAPAALFGLLAVEVFLEALVLGLERLVFVPKPDETFPVMPGLVLPVGGVLYGSGREIPQRGPSYAGRIGRGPEEDTGPPPPREGRSRFRHRQQSGPERSWLL